MVYTLEYQLLDDEGNQLDEGGLHYNKLKIAKEAIDNVEHVLKHGLPRQKV